MDKENLSRRYCGGEAANLGKVKQLTPTTFKAFVQQKLGLPIQLSLSRDDYWALESKEERDKVKRVAYVTPCVFKGATPTDYVKRVHSNTGKVSLICLDLDDPAHASPLYRNPELLTDQLHPFGYALYTTASSTDEAPRLRLMVDAAALAPERYKDALAFICERIGVPAKDIGGENHVVQPMFLPVQFANVEEEDHPLKSFEFTGRRGVHTEDLDAWMTQDTSPTPEDSEESLEKLGFKKGESLPTDHEDILDYCKAPVDGVSLEDMEQALEYVDPDCAYSDWINVAAGMRHQFFDKESQEQAYILFDKWSARGKKYGGRDNTRAKWDSFKHTPKGRVPSTIRSVMFKAAQNGWAASDMTERCFGKAVDWITGDMVVPENRWVATAIAKVAQIPLLSYAQEESLLRATVAEASRRLGIKLSLPTLKKDLKKVRAQETLKKEEEGKIKTPAWAMNLVFVESLDKFYRRNNAMLYSHRAVDSAYGRHLLKLSKDESVVATGKPDVRPVDYLLNRVQIPTVYDMVYEPQTTDAVVKVNGFDYVNSYVPTYPRPRKEHKNRIEDTVMTHMNNLFKDGDHIRTMIDWLAWTVQYPGVKIRWSPLVQGAQGCGKTYFYELCKTAVGVTHTAVVTPQALASQYNEWAFGRVLIALEEIRVKGRNRYEILNKLKPLITNDEIGVDRKHEDSRTVRNTVNYILFTNYHDALPITDTDRRYFVLKCRQQTRDSVLQLERMKLAGGKYFDTLYGVLEEFPGGVRSFLEEWVISDSFKANGRAPHTRFAADLAREAESPMSSMLTELLAEKDEDPNSGPILLTRDVVSTRELTTMAEIEGLEISPVTVGNTLVDAGYIFAGRRRLSDGERHGLYVSNACVEQHEDTPIAALAKMKAEDVILQRSCKNNDKYTLL